MSLQTRTTIRINGEVIPHHDRFFIHQEMDAHHFFEVVCRMDYFEEALGDLLANTGDFIGCPLSVHIVPVNFLKDKEAQFKGVVTAIESVQGYLDDEGDWICIKGKSPCELLEDGPHSQSFVDDYLSSMVKYSLAKYPNTVLKTRVTISRDIQFPYMVRYQESTFEFLSRLAARSGEWFYYDGRELVFGRPGEEETDLYYGNSLGTYHFFMQPVSNNYKYVSHDYVSSQVLENATRHNPSLKGNHHKAASQKSHELYPNETVIPLEGRGNGELNREVEIQKKGTQSRQVWVKGTSEDPSLHVGGIINIYHGEAKYGSYRVTKVRHVATGDGEYHNSFEALPADVDIWPHTNIHLFPEAGPQVATVTQNDDPEGLGRVKVKFPWQGNTHWIRVVTPHAGGDKGFHFIPEVGEEVLVGFEGGNAEKPYVTGSLYHGKANPGSFTTKTNDIKAIRTRSGHTIELNDTKGGESITITDQKGNVINIDTAGNNITITALENMTLNAKNFALNVEENASFNIGKNTEIYTGEDLDVAAKNISNEVEEEMHTQVGGALTQLSAEAEIQSDGDLKLSGAGLSELKGGSDVKISKG